MNAAALPLPHDPIAPSAAPRRLAMVYCELASAADALAAAGPVDQADEAERWRRLHRLARMLLREFPSREVDRSDGFLAVFEQPRAAVTFALALVRGLRGLTAGASGPQARIGIEYASASLIETPPEQVAEGAPPLVMRGAAVRMAAHLMRRAHPGQVLLSAAAAEATQQDPAWLNHGAQWRSHGWHWLGEGRIRIVEVGDPDSPFLGLRAAWPRWLPLRRSLVLFGLFGLVLVLAGAWMWRDTLRSRFEFGERDWVVLGDIVNAHGSFEFDRTLDTALRLGIERSSYVNVLSDAKARETLALMYRDPDRTLVDRELGSEIAIRDGSRALIVPTVERSGDRVRVTLEVVDPATRATVWARSEEGGHDEAALLSTIERVTRHLRGALGESMATVAESQAPLERVATASLDALRAYTDGENLYDRSPAQAAQAYERAVRIDPDFALARIGLARAFYSMGAFADAHAQIELAARGASRLSQRDQAYLEAWRATFGAPGVALAKWKALAEAHPDFFIGGATYAFFAWQDANRIDDALAAMRRIVSPHNVVRSTSYYVLGILELGSENVEQAIDQFARADSLGILQQNLYYASAYAVRRQFGQAERRFGNDRSGFVGEANDLALAQASFAIDQGDVDAARAAIARIAGTATDETPASARIAHVAQLALELALNTSPSSLRSAEEWQAMAALSGDAGLDHRALEEALSAFVAYAAARTGEVAQAEAIVARLSPRTASPDYPLAHQLRVVAEAEILRRKGRARDAVEALKPLLDGSELFQVRIALMHAESDLGDAAAARQQAEWLVGHRGRAYTAANPFGALRPHDVAMTTLALLDVAEAAHRLGDAEAAREAVSRFETLWPRAARLPGIAARLDALRQAFTEAETGPQRP